MKSENLKNQAGYQKDASEKIKGLGLCLGASTVSVVQVELNGSGPEPKPRITDYSLHSHEGDPRQTLVSALKGIDLDTFDRIATTGRKFRRFVNLSSISEPEAVEYAYQFAKPPGISCPAVVSAGGETFMVYVLDNSGRISNVLTGNKCASGTGEFFLQQLRRMDVSLEEAAQWAALEEAHNVSGRCSVFCKSDCTHATNKGIPKPKVTAGLCKMMAEKILELLKKVDRENIMVTGGTTLNQMMIEYLSQEIPGLIVPEEGTCFEALGAALWSLENDTALFPGISELFKTEAASFDILPPLRASKEMVEFKTVETDEIRKGDVCILGLDVGSTTTKAVLLRKKDCAILGSVYLRTNGDPVGASRECYRSVLNQVSSENSSLPIVTGLGVCGSGRQIAGLHALTDGVINEIIAHAAAAVHFDPHVDTIFEIGGQDAKYTYITNGVPSDYAMNEACSAGTGSFLEESAYETLGIKTEDIAEIALKGKNPPNFNDQCAAFIASDIKNAIHEGTEHEDIVAGLVYSICMNYSNRVKGNRPMGKKIFMQGGVCYNGAVPLAMASLVGKNIIVPPEPGLMGAFGVALEVRKRTEMGLMQEKQFDLRVLADREVKYGKSFICKGGKEKCDRSCEIAVIEIEGKKYPFGGACNRYYNLRHNIKHDAENYDMVRMRQRLVFRNLGIEEFRDSEIQKFRNSEIKDNSSIPKSLNSSIPESLNSSIPKSLNSSIRGRVGINRSFLVNTYYPLYSAFFRELGFEPVVPNVSSQEGIDKKEAPFCYPGELTHGFFHTLLHMENPPEFIFLPHFKAVPSQNGETSSQVCPFVQGETFYLQTTFREKIRELNQNSTKILTPLFNLTKGLAMARKPMTETAAQMGADRKRADMAFTKALKVQTESMDRMRDIGKKALEELEADPDKIAAVVFARPYNGFVEEAHMGIPHKLASRGIPVIPLDFLPLDSEKTKRHMYWGMGQLIMKAARFVKKHPQLFGIYITNFSCGPDSFLIGYFRDIMGQKPSLTLELDSHTADAGLETRIEAFLDIISAYRQIVETRNLKLRTQNSEIKSQNREPGYLVSNFQSARTGMNNGIPKITTSSGEILPMTDPRVTFLIPSMGRTSSEALAAAFRSSGINALALPPSDEEVLKLGRANTSCKECLPLILSAGSLLNYLGNGRRKDEIVVYFMATASGPCRFGQYRIFLEDLVKKQELSDVAMFSLSAETSYTGLGNGFHQRAWWAIVTADVMEDIRSVILANAADMGEAIKIFTQEWGLILGKLETGDFSQLEKQLILTSERFRQIPMRRPPEEVPVISLVGEIFVRRDSLSRQHLTERLAERGFATVCASIAEWLHYCDFLADNNLVDASSGSVMDRIKSAVRKKFMTWYEKRIKSALSGSGLVQAESVRISSIINKARPYISENLTCEAILTVGSALADVASHACGVIAIGPFGCMPNRMSEAILSETMNREEKLATEPKNGQLRAILSDIEDLPFLAIETDGSPFPQLIDAKLETFYLRAERLHNRMRSIN